MPTVMYCIAFTTTTEWRQKVLKTFLSKLIRSYRLVDVYENKYLIRYTLGSDFKTLEQKDLQTFKERFIRHIKENGLNIIE